ncbi:MAG TPA: carboxypeptidase-like regulatory domain-containing protein [Thermoanaerobaculia bacterium]
MPTSRLPALVLLLSFPAAAAAVPIRVTGSLIEIDRAGLTGARIELYPAWESYEDAVRRLTTGKREPEPLATALTDEQGRFEILAPTAGGFRLVARREGHVPLEAPLLPLTEDTDLPPSGMLQGKLVEIWITGPDGRPLPGIEVRISPVDRTSWGWDGEDPSQWHIDSHAVSGSDGRLTFPWHELGSLRLTVTSPAFLGQTMVLDRFGPKDARTVFSLKPRKVRIEIRDGEGRPVPQSLVRWRGRPVAVAGPDGRLEIGVPEEDPPLVVESREGWRARIAVPAGAGGIVPVRLEPPRRIAGKVVDAGTGRPVTGALVWSGWPLEGPPALSDAAGAFQVEAAPVDAWVNASAAGFFPGERQPVSKGAAVLKLEPSAALEGRVVDSSGQPVAGAWIAASPPRIRNRRPQQATGRSRAGGAFRLTGLLHGGVYELTTLREGFARTRTPAKTAPRGKPSPFVTIVLSDGQAAVGRVVDAAGQPVEGAEIQLLARYLAKQEAATVSGPEGRFEFRRLSPGKITLLAEHPDHAAAFVPQIEIPEGTPTVDLGTITLPASGAIEGRVIDVRGRPLEGAEVGAFPTDREHTPGWLFGRGTRSDPLRTEPDGSFRVERLRRGDRFNLVARHPGYLDTELPGVTAPTDEPVRIEMKVAHTLSGQVVNPEGEPVPEARVERVEESALGRGRSSFQLGSTDAEGRFRLTGLPSGGVDLTVRADGYAHRRLKAVQIPETGESEELRIVLDRGAVLEVHLTDAEGRPVSGATVEAAPETPPNPEDSESLWPPYSPFQHSDSQGRCRIQVPAPGIYRVSASRQHRSATERVQASPGITTVELRFPPGVEVSGRVLAPEGSPAVGAGVHFRQDDRGGPIVQAQADGTFLMEGLPDGEYRLVAQDRDGRSSRPLDLQIAGRSITGLELVLDQPSERATLSGRVSGPPPEALRGIRVMAIPSTPPHWDRATESGAGGEYRLEHLEPGEWTVRAMSPYGEAEGKVRLDPGAPAVLDLEIAPGLTLSGRVLVDGAPLSGAQIQVRHRQGERGGYGSTAYDGTFKIPGLRPGPQVLLVANDRGLGGSRTFELKESRELLVEISTGRLQGRIVAESGEPLDDTEVRIEGVVPGTDLSFMTPGARSGEDGSFEVRLGAGQYKVRVQKPGFAPFETTVGVPPGGEGVVEIPLKIQAEP